MLEVSSMPDSETPARPTRRRFSDEYKLDVVRRYDTLGDPHEKGALLRREGLYTSHIAQWRKLVRNGKPRKRGRAPKGEEVRELERLRKEIAKLRNELAKAEKIIEVQGKVSALLHQLAGKSQAAESEH